MEYNSMCVILYNMSAKYTHNNLTCNHVKNRLLNCWFQLHTEVLVLHSSAVFTRCVAAVVELAVAFSCCDNAFHLVTTPTAHDVTAVHSAAAYLALTSHRPQRPNTASKQTGT